LKKEKKTNNDAKSGGESDGKKRKRKVSGVSGPGVSRLQGNARGEIPPKTIDGEGGRKRWWGKGQRNRSTIFCPRIAEDRPKGGN